MKLTLFDKKKCLFVVVISLASFTYIRACASPEEETGKGDKVDIYTVQNSADIVFYRTSKTLLWPSKNKKWDATSGPYGFGVLPAGLYNVGRREISTYSQVIDSPFRDKTNRGFFIPVYPKFETERGKRGGRLGIHPDGNNPGTAGCIGIANDNTKDFYNAIGSTLPSAQLVLEVK